MNFLAPIRKIVKSKFDLIRNEHLKKNLLNALPFWTGAFISGAFAVLYAKLFSWAEQGTHIIYAKSHWAFFIITPMCFVIAWWIVSKYAPYARGSGIPQVSAAIELTKPKDSYKINILLSLRIIFIKILSSLIMVFGGGAIGREGPTIQISASIFKKINDLLPAWYPKISKRNMLVTGAASGLAAAFNTPLGGIVFAIEELTKMHFSFFKSALLTGVIIAGLTALNFSGPYLYLGYPALEGISTWIILCIIPIAIITGLAGSFMGTLILFIFKLKKGLKSMFQKGTYVAICGLLIALIAVFIDTHTFGSGKEIMNTTLFSNQKQVEWYLPILRMLGPILSFSTGASGGIFAPSLSAGASIGALLSGWFHLSPTETNLLILCGMTGFLTSITRSPFTSSILVLEMTNSHNIIFYIMLTALFANLVATLVSKHSFYDHLKDQYIREIHASEPSKKEE
ncbi:MAG: chloride channel protein [Chitinophagaceae bacterium]|nr:chloride channel protein [Chitinophagaceae bacterium]MCA6455429.1 chloride channel protein [Chitinophagaceae bacterium]MCA6458301.1 chloride channel protein [Chitinophagaceae bacterium]MCA6464013.1 chloride channel protein [Chitinophagaceae bacterium]MEA3427193.1 chloride channel protein [Bacteroidota bacterium]